MAVSRPIGKDLLKKLLLKQMAKEGTISVEWQLENRVPGLLEIDRLTRQEQDAAHQGCHELYRDGLIMQDPRAGDRRAYMLTEWGKEAVAGGP